MILLNRIFTVLTVIFICSNVSVNAKVYPVEEWAKRDEVKSVSISPGGDMMAMLRIMESKANPILEIYDAADISQRPFRMDADPMEIMDYSWVSETKIIFSARQKVRDKIEGWNQGVFKYASTMLIYDKKNKEMATTWNVVVRKEDEENPVRLYCPHCWNTAQEVISNFLKTMEEKDEP